MLEVIAAFCLVWYFFILTVCAIGFFQIQRNYTSRCSPPVSITFPLSRIPHVTILRPVKGLEPHLYECLCTTFHQTYPTVRLTIYFCISSRDDPAFPILQRLLADFPGFDAKLFIEEEDPNLSGFDGRIQNLGSNPKIRNMSRGYREAKGDILWIIDCNVWISKNVAGSMVDQLCGFTANNVPSRKHKFVHQLPLVVDVSGSSSPSTIPILSTSNPTSTSNKSPPSRDHYGGLLEELFLSTAHAKFYTAISYVAIAPCIVGKSNMFRRSHLNALTASNPARAPGIDYFSDNICEDHLIGDLLWRSPIPRNVWISAEKEGQDPSSSQDLITESNKPRTPYIHPSSSSWRNHALLPSSLAIQPTSNMPLSVYLSRRTRWLRVRKFTVTLATLVEPGTESVLCSLYGAIGLTASPLCNSLLHIPNTWFAFFSIWILSVIGWMLGDRYIWSILQGGSTFAKDGGPTFARKSKRGWGEWGLAWLARETLAFPVWCWAFWGGVEVVWRGKRFWVGMDMRVHEIKGGEDRNAGTQGTANGNGVGGKYRRGE